MEIFYRYDTDLEDDNCLDFRDLLERVLVLFKRRLTWSVSILSLNKTYLTPPTLLSLSHIRLKT